MTHDQPTAPERVPDDVQASDVIVSAADDLVMLGFESETGEWSLLGPDDAETIGRALIAHAQAARERSHE